MKYSYLILIVLISCTQPIVMQYDDPTADSLVKEFNECKTGRAIWDSANVYEMLAQRELIKKLTRLDSAIVEELKKQHVVDSLQAMHIEAVKNSLVLYKHQAKDWDSIQWFHFKDRADSMQNVYYSALEFFGSKLDSAREDWDMRDTIIIVIETDTAIILSHQFWGNVIIDCDKLDTLIYEGIIDSLFRENFWREIIRK